MYPPQGSGSGGGGSGSSHDLGWYLTAAALAEAFPTSSPGDYGFVANNGHNKTTIFIWDDDEEGWVDSGIEGIVTAINQEGIVETGEVKVTLEKLGLSTTDDLTEGSSNLYHANADWNITDTTKKAYIKNKPTIPTAGNGLKSTNGVFAAYPDGITLKINSYGQLSVISGSGGGSSTGSYADAAFADSPSVVANNTVGNIEPGYVLSGKCFRTIIRQMTNASVVYPTTTTPYYYGLLLDYATTNVTNTSVTGLGYTINETKSSKRVNFGGLSKTVGYVTIAYPYSYGELDSIEIGTGDMSEDISDDFATTKVTISSVDYMVYVRQYIAEFDDEYYIRFVTSESTVPNLSCSGGNDDDGIFDGGDANDWS